MIRIDPQIQSCLRYFFACVFIFATYTAPAQSAPRHKTLVALGDSLTAGYGLAPDKGFVARLTAALLARGHRVKIIDAGVSGDTSAGGLSRLAWVLPDNQRIDGMILELGANDALRGIDPKVTRRNLAQILKAMQARQIPVLLAGMYAPRNLSQDYQTAFNRIYPELAAAHNALLYPFFLDGVAAEPNLNLSDGIHPNEAGVDLIVARILPSVEALLEKSNR